MKTLYMVFFILFCSTTLYAGTGSVLTEIEQIQEKIWYLQRDVGEHKASLAEQQKQLVLLASDIARERLELNGQLTALTQANAGQEEAMMQMENDLATLSEALIALTAEVGQYNSALQDQAGKISTLEGALKLLQNELMAQRNDTGPVLTDLRAQLAEARTQTTEIRSQLDTLGQDVGGQVEQIGYLGAGAFLVLSMVLIIGYLARKGKEERPRLR